jgi:hypothetical protein
MVYLKTLGDKVEDAAVAGGRLADALVRATGYLVSGALAFADREMEFASQAMKKRKENRMRDASRGTSAPRKGS